MRPMLVDASPIDFRRHDLFFLNRTLCDDFTVRSANKALSPKFNAVSTGRRFVTDAIRHGHIATVRDGMTTLNRFPRGMLRLSKFLFLARVPPYCGWIKDNFCPAQGG